MRMLQHLGIVCSLQRDHICDGLVSKEGGMQMKTIVYNDNGVIHTLVVTEEELKVLKKSWR